ncbi:MAG TPA: FAD-dependent 5-carboxymethylaminomethyl-2-thiouridine(34) oxidoreductase MnmC, partial [Rubrivivax sp.]|nr:FAD-dependent 5-carboxymethylaminomethyl-2-thiouridine(34) oxidoreductase MnmC [Rubrivivax sp.]
TLATWSVARDLRADLTSAGFEVRLAQGKGGKREITLARYAPRFMPPPRPTTAVDGSQAVIVGGGIAGAAAARALLQAGLEVTVIDRQAAPAAETSGNPAGLFHGTVHADDGPHARLFRGAALMARRDYGGHARGLLRLGASLTVMQDLLRQQNLPSEYVQALRADEAAALAGVLLPGPAWFYPGGGWLDARAWVCEQLSLPGVRWIGQTSVARLSRHAAGWRLHDRADQVVADAPVVVLANAAGAMPLLTAMQHASWPLTHSRGQVTVCRPTAAGLPRLPVAGDGYAIALPDGRLLCGATRDEEQAADDGRDSALREADQHHNLSRLQRLTGIVAPADPSLWSGRTGWRLQAADRLPVAGAVPLAGMPQGQRMDQVRLLPRERGLFVLTALGARGLTLAPLLGRLVAAQATGSPWPVEQDLADAVDPARWLVRAARRANSGVS